VIPSHGSATASIRTGQQPFCGVNLIIRHQPPHVHPCDLHSAASFHSKRRSASGLQGLSPRACHSYPDSDHVFKSRLPYAQAARKPLISRIVNAPMASCAVPPPRPDYLNVFSAAARTLPSVHASQRYCQCCAPSRPAAWSASFFPVMAPGISVARMMPEACRICVGLRRVAVLWALRG